MKKIFQKLILLSVLSIPVIPVSAQTWSQKGSDIDGEAYNDKSGYSVSMPDANTMAIGAVYNDGSGITAGHVRVYVWNGSAWAQKGADIDGEAAWDESGFSVSMPDANTVAIGAPQNKGKGSESGHVRVYTWNGTAWAQKGTDIDSEAAGDRSGRSISMPDANTLAIGAIQNDGSASNAGHVRVYTWSGTAWVQKGADIDGEAAGDASGYSVSMPDANTVAIGAIRNDTAGHVRVYTWSGTAWVQKGADIDGEAADDASGYSVSMPDANTVAIGAPFNDGSAFNAGHVRVYAWNGSAWAQKGADIDGEAERDASGSSVMMPDANTVAIGAPDNNGSGSQVGHVRVYTWNGTAWVQNGADIDGEADYDNSGGSVSMPDANTVAIGARNHDTAGHVRVYSFSIGSSIVTWDGGGSDERFFTKENWVGDICPRAGDDILFNGTGSNTKHCILDSSLTLGTITLRSSYKGRFRVEKSGVVLAADSIVTHAPMIVLNPETGTFG
jgi:hypothetical protein